jgi:hypothetical protein
MSWLFAPEKRKIIQEVEKRFLITLQRRGQRQFAKIASTAHWLVKKAG